MAESSDVIAWRSNDAVEIDNLVDVVVAPDGLNKSPKGDFLIDAEAWKSIEKNFKDRDGVDLVFDFDHQTLGGEYARRDGKSPAAGWIKALRYEPGRGIIASVEWTDEARNLIRTKQYKYPSGVFTSDKKSKRVIEIDSVAITNRPATRGIEPLAASERVSGVEQENKAMPKTDTKGKKLRERLQVMQEATPDDAAAIADEVVEEVDEVGAAIAELKATLGLGEDVGPVDVIKAAMEKLAGPAEEGGEGEEAAAESEALSALKERVGLEKGCTVQALSRKYDELHTTRVSATDHKTVTDRLAALEADKASASRDALVQSYVDGDPSRLNPNDTEQMAWANKAALADPEGFKVIMAKAPAIHAAGQLVNDDGTGPKTGRAKIIASAGKEWEDEPDKRMGASKKSYVLAVLSETDESDLTEAETKALIG